MIEDDCDLRKMSVTAVKSAQAAKEAIVALSPSYDICKVLMKEFDGDEAAKNRSTTIEPSLVASYLHRYPSLVREAAWLHKMSRVCSRYLKHLSFLYRLFKDIDAFHIEPQKPVVLPKPRRAVLPAPWWGMEEDRDCLLGTRKHGWGNWKAICEDPEYCFKQKGVVYHNQKEEEEELLEGEGEQEANDVEFTQPAAHATPLSQEAGEVHFFPTTQLLMKRIRRLVDAMEITLAKGFQATLDCVAPSSPHSTPKRPKKTSALFLGNWTVKETKAIRNAVLQWGLPVPPVSNLSGGRLFAMTSIPLMQETKDREAEYACVCDVVDELVRSVVNDNEPKRVSPTLPTITGQPEKSVRDKASYFHYHRCPVCLATQQKYCIYCDMYIYYRVLKIEANVLYKSYQDVQFITRYIEENAVKLVENPPAKKTKKDASAKTEGGAAEGEKALDVETVIPSAILAQRIYSRLQLFYDLQLLVWKNDHRVLEAFMKRWMTSGMHHQDNVTKGWSPPIHDVALLEGIYRWGVVEWDIVWRDPLLPFYIDENEEQRRKEAGKKRGAKRRKAKGETPEAETPPAEESTTSVPHDSRPPYTLEDAKEKKDPSVKREWLVSGLPSLYVLKRVNAILRFFKQWRSVGIVTTVDEAPREIGVVIGDSKRRVAVTLRGVTRMTRAEVRVVEEVFWKKNQKVGIHASYPHRPQTDHPLQPFKQLDAWNHPVVENELIKAQQMYYKQLFFQQQQGVVLSYPYSARASFPGVANPPTTPQLFTLSRSVAVKAPLMSESNLQCIRESRAFLQSVQLPYKVKGVTVLSFGHIVTQWKSYHSAKYIWPVGFKWLLGGGVMRRSTKMYYSFKNPLTKVLYTSEILDGGADVVLAGCL